MRIHNKQRVAVVTVVTLLATLVPIVPGTRSEANGYGLSNPRVVEGVSTWDCIYFGNYWQNDSNQDGVADKKDAKSPIKWRVLSVNGDDAFLIADRNLDAQQYHDRYGKVTWEESLMRSWLNGYGAEQNAAGKDYTYNNFLDNAFSANEQNAISVTTVVNEDSPKNGIAGGNDTMDKVYLPSVSEVTNEAYGFCLALNAASNTVLSVNTAYVADGGEIDSDFLCKEGAFESWWLRSPGEHFWCAAAMHPSGFIYEEQVDQIEVALRPMIHLNLSDASLWSHAGTFCSSELTTALPTFSPSERVVTPAKPKVVRIKEKKNAIQVKWKKVIGAKGYEICYSTSKKFKKKNKTKSKFTKKTKITIKNLKRKKRYYVRVRAYTLQDGTKIYGKWSKVTKVKIK